MNIEHLRFTCPKCGSHEYLRVDHCLACYKEHSLRRIDGNPMPGETEPELSELEPRGLAGLRCAKCMYPDTCRTRFRWKSWQATHVSGSLVTGEDGVEAVEMAVHARRKKDGATKTFTSADYPQFRLTDADSLSFFKYFTSADA